VPNEISGDTLSAALDYILYEFNILKWPREKFEEYFVWNFIN
jgi:hypothetical protein